MEEVIDYDSIPSIRLKDIMINDMLFIPKDIIVFKPIGSRESIKDLGLGIDRNYEYQYSRHRCHNWHNKNLKNSENSA